MLFLAKDREMPIARQVQESHRGLRALNGDAITFGDLAVPLTRNRFSCGPGARALEPV